MHYTELEVIDKMHLCKKSNPDTILGYLLQLPDWRELVFPRHIKYINSLLQSNGSYYDISKAQGITSEGVENIFRKIETCLRLEIEYKNNQKVKQYDEIDKPKKIVRNSDKDDMLNSMFNYIKNIPNIDFQKVKDPMRLKVLELVTNDSNILDLETKLGINATSIYSCLISSDSDSIFIDLK